MSHIATETGKIIKLPPHRQRAGEVSKRKDKVSRAICPAGARHDGSVSSPTASSGSVIRLFDNQDVPDEISSCEAFREPDPLDQHRIRNAGNSIIQDSSDTPGDPICQAITSAAYEDSLTRLRSYFAGVYRSWYRTYRVIGRSIHPDVLRNELCTYLGDHVFIVIPGEATGLLDDVLIISLRLFTKGVLVELLKASNAFVEENRLREMTGLQYIAYIASETHRRHNDFRRGSFDPHPLPIFTADQVALTFPQTGRSPQAPESPSGRMSCSLPQFLPPDESNKIYFGARPFVDPFQDRQFLLRSETNQEPRSIAGLPRTARRSRIISDVVQRVQFPNQPSDGSTPNQSSDELTTNQPSNRLTPTHRDYYLEGTRENRSQSTLTRSQSIRSPGVENNHQNEVRAPTSTEVNAGAMPDESYDEAQKVRNQGQESLMRKHNWILSQWRSTGSPSLDEDILMNGPPSPPFWSHDLHKLPFRR